MLFLSYFWGEFTETKEFVNIIKSKEINFKYANGCRDIHGKEIHTYHEIFYFINGDADFICSKGRKTISSGTLVIIPKETFHQFHNNTTDSNYMRCVLNFDKVSELDAVISSKMKEIYLLKSPKIDLLFKDMISITKENYDNAEKFILLKSLLAQLLISISIKQKVETVYNENYNIAYDIMSFINQNITKNISITEISNHFHISNSHIFRIFKSEFNISVHKYILENRLIIAHKMISESVPASIVAKECGFSSYPNFYRQYKKMFGVNPSNRIFLDKE